jgi:hypothetical protein
MNLIELFKNCVSLDAETTGLLPEVHGVISLSVVSLTSDEEHTFECYLRRGCVISDQALEVNGENRAELLDRKNHPDKYISEYQMVKNLHDILNKNNTHVIVGKNPGFDKSFVKAAYSRNAGELLGAGIVWTGICHRTIDYSSLAVPLMLVSGMTIPETGFSSDDISTFLEIPPEGKPHTSINGARHNKKCLLEILSRYQKLGITAHL